MFWHLEYPRPIDGVVRGGRVPSRALVWTGLTVQLDEAASAHELVHVETIYGRKAANETFYTVDGSGTWSRLLPLTARGTFNQQFRDIVNVDFSGTILEQLPPMRRISADRGAAVEAEIARHAQRYRAFDGGIYGSGAQRYIDLTLTPGGLCTNITMAESRTGHDPAVEAAFALDQWDIALNEAAERGLPENRLEAFRQKYRITVADGVSLPFDAARMKLRWAIELVQTEYRLKLALLPANAMLLWAALRDTYAHTTPETSLDHAARAALALIEHQPQLLSASLASKLRQIIEPATPDPDLANIRL